MDNWSIKDSKIFVSSKLPKSPALGYVKPEIKKVAIKISSDHEDFIPTYSEDKNAADLFLNTPKELIFPKGSQEIIDCGFSLEVPAGYKVCVSSVISSVFITLIDSSRIKVNAINFGEEIILQYKQKIGKIWVEPVYFFDWIKKG